jgi:hypothetical protein
MLLGLLGWSAQAETGGWIWKELSVSSTGFVLHQGTAEFERSGPSQVVRLLQDGGSTYAILELRNVGDIWKGSLRRVGFEEVVELEGRESERASPDRCQSEATAMFHEAFVLTDGWTTLHLMVAYCDT